MEKKLIQVGLMGMNKDTINSKTAQQQAYEIKNFRLSATQDSNAFELTTERGTKSIPLEWTDEDSNLIQVKGTIIGYCILNNYLILFTTQQSLEEFNKDRIYRLTLNSNEFKEEVTEIVELYEGNTLNFSCDNLIDAIPYYETELIQKVYWIDGKNQPRVINIANVKDTDLPRRHINDIDYDPYGFVQEIQGNYNSIEVIKGYVGGMFHAGVIQYAYSFFNENAQETPVVDTTPLYYIAHEDRGEKPDTRVGCTFTLSLEIPRDFLKKFDYVRFYSIYRSSLDTTPLVKVVNEIEINDPNATGSKTYSFIDDNTQGYVYDAQQLLIRNNKIIPQTFNYKDGKLFFGNFKNEIDLSSVSNLKTQNFGNIEWEGKEIQVKNGTQAVYDYINQLIHNSQEIKTFKFGEHYKFGIQLQDKYGNWSQPIGITTKTNNLPPTAEDQNFQNYLIAKACSTKIVSEIVSSLGIDTSDYIRIRPIVSFPKSSERKALCQGIVNPTVFNLGQRENKTCYAQASWFFRPIPTNNIIGQEGYVKIPGGDDSMYGWGTSFTQWKKDNMLFNTTKPNGEIQSMYTDDDAYTQLQGGYQKVTATSYDLSTEYNNYEQFTLHIGKFGNTVHALNKDDNSITENFDYYSIDNTYEWLNVIYYIFIKRQSLQLTLDTYNSNGESLGQEQVFLYIYKTFNGYISNGTAIYYSKDDESFANYHYAYEGDSDIYVLSSDVYNQLESHSITPPFESIRPRKQYSELSEQQDKEIYNSFYFVDTEINTINSPDLEFDTNISQVDISNYEVRNAGFSVFNSQVGKYYIVAESPLFLNSVKAQDEYIRSTQMAKGFFDKTWSNIGVLGGTQLSALNCWFDDACNLFTWDNRVLIWNKDKLMKSYVVYPWHRKYLNNFNNNQFLVENLVENDSDSGITNEQPTSTIIKKVLSNLRVGDSQYANTYTPTPISSLKIYNSEEPTLLKIESDLFYGGNIDQLIVCNSEYKGLAFISSNQGGVYNWELQNVQGYPQIVGQSKPLGDLSESCGKWFGFTEMGNESYGNVTTPNNRYTDSIWIRYKSSPHFVFKLKPQQSLVTLRDQSSNFINIHNYLCIYDITRPVQQNDPFEVINDDFDSLNRIWYPCGESLPLNSSYCLEWLEGDTFFQRYDCLKTYPFSNDDYQSVVEIGSFMLETRVNLDGRYDTNRGLKDNTAITKENFNLINPVYSQMNNFFQYRILDERFNNKETTYQNRITWTLDKQNGDDVDQWTRVTELGILDLDGDKGKVTKIERFDNNLYIFQDKGIARLNYNDNIQIPTEGNIPIEVVNSGFINGKRYISENQGLQDKWCSKSTPYGIFFKDGYSKALCTLKYDERRNPIIGPLSYGSIQKWTEQNIENIYRVNYDNQVNEVLFMINNEEYPTLAYSPLYQAFTAFYDYKGWITNYNNSTISLLKDDDYYSNTLPIGVQFQPQNIYFVRRQENDDEPEFNYFYDNLKPYWIKWTSVVDNYDCIFDNIYLKSNIYEQNRNSMNDEDIDITQKGYDIYQGDSDASLIPFDLISVSNDKQAYEQESSPALIWKDFKPIKKFGVWRGRIPRINSRDGKYLGSRIRNHWTRIGLKKENPSTEKTVVRDIKVDAFF